MQPGTVRAKKYLACPGTPDGFLQEVEAANSGRVRVDVGMADQMVNQGELRAPIIGKAAEMRDDKDHIGILASQEFHHGDFTHHVVQHGEREGTSDLADLPCNTPIITVYLDAAKPVLLHRRLDHREHSAAVSVRVDECESVKAIGRAGDDARYFAVGHRVVRMEGGKEHRAVDPCPGRPPKILPQRRRRVPRPGQPIAFARVTMAVNDHRLALVGVPPAGRNARRM